MKNYLFRWGGTSPLILLFGLFILLSSCSDSRQDTNLPGKPIHSFKNVVTVDYAKITFEDHEYIVFQGASMRDVYALHSQSCPAKHNRDISYFLPVVRTRVKQNPCLVNKEETYLIGKLIKVTRTPSKGIDIFYRGGTLITGNLRS